MNILKTFPTRHRHATLAPRSWQSAKSMLPWLLAAMLSWTAASSAQAHLAESQRGTLNFMDSGAYLTLSLPASSLSGFDDDRDGMISIAELRAHGESIEAQIKQGVSLHSDHGPLALDGLIINAEPSDSDPSAPSTHLVVFGRFSLPDHASDLAFSLRLFGTRAEEQTEQIAITRGEQSQLITLTPLQTQRAVLPSTWARFAEQVRLGAFHVLSGADHLLFLLVALAASWNFRQAALALTCFTAGHAATLVACGWHGLSVPSGVVEPAIAATIVGMALFDRWSARRVLAHAFSIRLSLVFFCALIHGLGLAGALDVLGLHGMGKIANLIGFNAGIELGQIAVAFAAALAMRAVVRLGGPVGLEKTTRFATYLSLALGSFWFIQRTLG